MSERELDALAARVGERLHAAGRRLATAESCTAGWIAKAVTDIAGSSAWFECGYVTYSDAAKQRDLGVAGHTLAEFGAVSEQTAREMAGGALRVPGVSVAIAVTGIAGPDGGTPAKPVGTVWFCAAARLAAGASVLAERQQFPGDRVAVRGRAVRHALEMLLRLPLEGA
ncbi:MAG TPA: nicotinamide-nucleotide amidohydrolase family protein [Steroidobacteraceae bacterium]|nr:nicotinamide-nucleotide amidohydrolase family protein [Gammaproteobacteria bacterium]HEV2286149.1 nicotinamide-nucleotide amidohydrolase family protein [Steroidobacteraceae bacterium]